MRSLILLGQLFFVISVYAGTSVQTTSSQFLNNKCEKVFTKEIVFTEEVLLVIQELAKLYNKIIFSQVDSEEIVQGKIIFKANMNELVQRLSPEEFKLAKRLIYSQNSELIARITQANARELEEQRRKKFENEEAIKNVEAYAEAEKNTLRLKEILDVFGSRSFIFNEDMKLNFESVRNDIEVILNKPITNINVVNQKNETILILAANYGDKIIVDLALKQQAAVNAKNIIGLTALMEAANYGFKEIVQMLVDAKADIDSKSKTNHTALILAAWNGHKEIVQMLIKTKADVDAIEVNGMTALTSAAWKGHKEIVQMLIKTKADVDVKDKYQNTALIWAAKKGYKEIVQILIVAQANLNAKNKDGATALMLAAWNGHKEIVRMLLDAKADVNEVNNDGKTALMEAANYGYEEIVQMLKAATASSNNTFGISTIRKSLASVFSKAYKMLKASGAKE